MKLILMIAEIKTDTIVMFVTKEYIVIRNINGELMIGQHNVERVKAWV